MAKIDEIQRLRGIAVMLVFFHHLGGHLLPTLRPLLSSWTGVDLFFVISGFVVTRSLLHVPSSHLTSKSVLAFYVRRVFRIAPLAILWLILPYFLVLYFNKFGTFGVADDTLADGWKALTLRYNYAYLPDRTGHYDYYWSLMVEEHFYLALPLCFWIIKKVPHRVGFSAAVVTMIGFVLRPFFTPYGLDPDIQHSLHIASHRHLDLIIVGVLLFLLAKPLDKLRPQSKHGRIAIQIAAYALIAIMIAMSNILSVEFFLRYGFTILIFVCGPIVLFASWNENLIFNIPGLRRILSHLGELSLGIYLSHVPILLFFDELQSYVRNGQWQFLSWLFLPQVQWAAILFTTLTVSEVLYRLIEMPMLRAGKRHSSTIYTSSKKTVNTNESMMAS